MTLRRRAPSSFKPLTSVAFLSLFSLVLAGLMVHLPSLAHAELPLPAKFAPPSGMPPNLPDAWDYGTVSARPIAGKQLRLSLKQVLAFDQTAAPTAASNLADVPAATDTEMPPATGVAEPQETSMVEILAAPSTTRWPPRVRRVRSRLPSAQRRTVSGLTPRSSATSPMRYWCFVRISE